MYFSDTITNFEDPYIPVRLNNSATPDGKGRGKAHLTVAGTGESSFIQVIIYRFTSSGIEKSGIGGAGYGMDVVVSKKET